MDHTLDFKTKFFKLEKSDLIASQDKYIVEKKFFQNQFIDIFLYIV